MEFLLFVLFFLLISIPLVLGHTIPIYKNHSKATGSIINYDALMRKFVYKINLSYQQVIELLAAKNATDELSCAFDLDNAIIRFSDFGSHRDYHFQIQECNGFSVLKLEQVASIGIKSSVPYKLNPFFVNKLQAEMLPFSKYEF